MARKTAVATASTAEVEVVTKPGLGIDEGIILTTFFVMIGAIVLTYIANQHYGV